MKKYPYLFITGCMGSGKSTVGEITAKKLGRRFIDLDRFIVKREGKNIKKIFKEVGEDGFRDIESQALKELPDRPLVIATGGGTVIRPENREYMKEKGAVLWLDISAKTLAKRLSGDRSRPLLAGKNKEEELDRLINERRPYYQDCTYRIDAEDLTPLQAAQEIIKFMKS